MNQQPAAGAVRRRPAPMMCEVARVERLTPRMVRVVLAGEALAGFATHGPAEHLKVFLPRPGQEEPVLPSFGPDGMPVRAEGAERPLSRTYTPRHWDAGRRELTIDFLVHGDGPGSAWASRAAPGMRVAAGGAGGPYRVDADAAWFVLAGDESALPAIATILEVLPASTPALVLVEVAGPEEEQALPVRQGDTLRWLHAPADPSRAGEALRAALAGLALPPGDGRLFVACEAGAVREIKRDLIFGRGLPREAVHCHGYWKLGEANHPDHDLAPEV